MNTRCANHLNEVFISFCKSCDRLVCLQCLEENEHQGHQFVSLKKMLQDRQEHLQIIENKESNLDSRASEEEHNISERAETLHVNIDATKAQLSEELNQYVNEHKKHLSDLKMDFINKIKFLNKIINASKSDVLTTEDDEQDATDSAQCNFSSSLVPMNKFDIPRFSFDNDSDVNKVFGCFEKETCDSGDADVELDEVVKGLDEMSSGTEPVDGSRNSKLDESLESNFYIKENRDGIVRIHPSSYNNSWITVCGSKEIALYSKDGSNIKNIHTRFNVFDIGVNQKQELFATEKSGHYVWKVALNALLSYKWTKFASFPNYVTNGIHINDVNHLWICLQNKRLEGKVVRISESGAVSQEIEFGNDKVRLLKCPMLVHQSTCTGDVLIVDGRRIVVVDKLGFPIFNISGTLIQTVEQVDECVSSEKFTPLEIANDKEGNIITSDFGNNKLWIFDKEGNFMRSLCGSHSGPTGIVLHSEEELWVALSDGKIIVLKYK